MDRGQDKCKDSVVRQLPFYFSANTCFLCTLLGQIPLTVQPSVFYPTNETDTVSTA